MSSTSRWRRRLRSLPAVAPIRFCRLRNRVI